MRVTLIDWPRDLIGTFSKVWAMSKTNGDWRNASPDEDEFIRVLDAEIPVLRYAQFVWIIEGMPVFFREQLVRAKHEDFWIQSMRVADLYHEGVEMGYLPEEDDVIGTYRTMVVSTYMDLIDAGYPEEVARRILPLSTLHRGAWFTNLQALLERFKKRSCWVAEDLWVEFLSQVRHELVTKVHKCFEHIATPPCYKRNSHVYEGCKIDEIMQHRVQGADPLPVCPLWAYRNLSATDMEYHQDVESEERTYTFAELWGRHGYTGAPISRGSYRRRHGNDRS